MKFIGIKLSEEIAFMCKPVKSNFGRNRGHTEYILCSHSFLFLVFSGTDIRDEASTKAVVTV